MSSPARIEEYPRTWDPFIDELAGRVTLTLAGVPTELDLPAEHLRRAYLPLLAMLDERAERRRVLAALAGVPGGGKSAFGGLLAHVADRLWGPQRLVLVAMDGWHLPNAVLDARTTTDEAGWAVPLRRRKGGPESYDVPALAEALHVLRLAGDDVWLPVYDRVRHDPVPASLRVPADARAVLVEGNYLLDREPPWDAVSSRFDVRLFLACPLGLARERVLGRHVRGGCTPEQAAVKYADNDQLNTRIVLAQSACADIVIHLEPEPAVVDHCAGAA